MGTRSLTRVIPRQQGLAWDKGHEHCSMSMMNMYRQSNGFPEGHGVELAYYLRHMRIINGIDLGREQPMGKYANGSSCLAAQIVGHFKDKVGDIYLFPNDDEKGWEDYIYTIYPCERKPLQMSVWSSHEDRCIFVGTPQELIDKFEYDKKKDSQ